MKTFEDNKIMPQKSKVTQWKNDKINIREESLELYGLVKKVTEKRMNYISNFEELKYERSLNINN